ncbi:MAG TPA: FG-GAP-like repeat-containing protein [Gemmatimonadaceae bacterium]
MPFGDVARLRASPPRATGPARDRSGAALATVASPTSYILWTNRATGEWGSWGMDGTTYVGDWTPLYPAPIDTAWRVVASADFTNDGAADLVWQNSRSGDVGIWPMRGPTWTGEHVAIGAVPTEWRIAAAADLTGDGHPDLVWQNTRTGERGAWQMEGTRFTGAYHLLYHTTVPTEWEIVGAADMNSDLQPDLVWQNVRTGERGSWIMGETTFMAYRLLHPGVPLAWDIATIADMTGDGETDLVWQHTVTGERGLWVMQDTIYRGEYRLLYPESVPTQWEIAAVLPAPLPPSTAAGRIAYALGWGEAIAGDVWASAPDGTRARRIAEVNQAAQASAFSPDGRTLVFRISDQMYTVGFDGSPPTHRWFTVSTRPRPQWHATSPPISWIDGASLSRASLTGSVTEMALPSRIGAGYEAVLSPDGTRIAFVEASVTSAGRYNYDLYVYALATGEYTRLTTSSDTASSIVSQGISYWPSWSPDGTRIAFSHKAPGARGYELFVTTADGSDLRQLTTFQGLGSVWESAFSPDGESIVYTYERGQSDLWVVRSDGSQNRRITFTTLKSETYPSWGRLPE